MIRTATYLRVSTDKQVAEGDSISAQRSALNEYIERHSDMVFVGEYCDDGVSGTKYDRDEFQRLLKDVEGRRIDLVICTRLDRIHRSLRNFLNMQDVFEKHHCNWLAIWEPQYDSSTAQGKMIINMMVNLAEFEANQTGQRIRQVQAYKVTQGEVISGSTPPGLKIVNKHIVPDENAPIILKAFQYYERHNNLSETMYAFDHYGIFPKTKPAWKAILRNEKYTGRFRGNPHFCPPIVPQDLFDEVQRKLSKNIKCDQKRTYIFSGLVVCAECGTKMGSIYQRTKCGRVVNRIMYRCKRHYGCKVKTCDNTKCIDEPVLERFLLERLIPEAEKMVKEGREKQSEVADNSKRISALQHKIAKLKDLYVNDLIPLEEYKADKEVYQAEIQSLMTSEPPKSRNTDALKKILDMDFESAYMEMSREQKRYFWRGLVEKVTVNKDRQIVPYFL